MRAPQFTPGPWESRYYGEMGQTKMYWVNPEVSLCVQNEADVHLIAAAPELYEALRVMVEDFADYPASERPCRAFDLANAALAKAVPQ